MREVIATGKTVEEATENGCQELGLGRDEVSVEILEMPVRKLFKTLPAKVKVTAQEALQEMQQPEKPQPKEEPKQSETEAPRAQPAPKAPPAPKQTAPESNVLPEEPEEPINLEEDAGAKRAVVYLSSIFDAMGVQDYTISAGRQGDATLLRIEGEGLAQHMDVRGDIIQALSYLTDRAVNKGIDKREAEYLRVRLDIAGYRNRREGELLALAKRTGEEVARTHRSRTLAPMNSYERLIVHTAISQIEGLTSESIGVDTERRVVVKSLAPDATEGDDWRPHGKGGHGGGRGNRNENQRGGRGGSRGRGGPRGGGRNDRDFKRSNTPEREYADQKRDENAAPVVPERREAIKDGEDLPLYGKIDI